MTNAEVLHQVEHGYRMQCPQGCPPALYDIMLECWHKDPMKRPTFETLQWQLEDFFTLSDSEYKEASGYWKMKISWTIKIAIRQNYRAQCGAFTLIYSKLGVLTSFLHRHRNISIPGTKKFLALVWKSLLHRYRNISIPGTKIFLPFVLKRVCP